MRHRERVGVGSYLMLISCPRFESTQVEPAQPGNNHCTKFPPPPALFVVMVPLKNYQCDNLAGFRLVFGIWIMEYSAYSVNSSCYAGSGIKGS